MKTFYWHDYETFGLNQRIDRPAQFAGIRTDEDLNIIGEPDIWYCRPAEDYLPQPGACLVTKITPQTAQEHGLSEDEFARRIHERFNETGTVSVGYNSLKFDDEISRFLFWRNLYDTYGREWKNECSRWDLFPLVLAVWALRPEGINWPDFETDDPAKQGRKSFRLEKITAANGLSHEHAHDAASDVMATIELARLIRQRQPRLWNWALHNRCKNAVAAALGSGRPCVWIDISAGQQRGFIRVVMPVAVNPANKNEFLVWDLSRDPNELLGMKSEDICRRAFGRTQDLMEGEKRLALRALKINTFPFVCDNIRVLTPDVCSRFGLDISRIIANGEALGRIRSEIEGPVIDSRSCKEETREPQDCDVALYEGFISPEDQAMMERLHGDSAEDFADDVSRGAIHFDDPRLEELFFRFRARNYPETLTDGEKAEWREHCRERLIDGKGPGLTLERYFEEIDSIAEADELAQQEGRMPEAVFEKRRTVLDALYDWGDAVANRVDEFEEEDAQ
jgi:exodeoxyribonuclease-1